MNYGLRFVTLYRRQESRSSPRKRNEKSKMPAWGGLTNSCEKKRGEKQRRKERYKHLNAEFQRIARRDKKVFLSDQCKEIEENNRMGKTKDLILTVLLIVKQYYLCGFNLQFPDDCTDHWGRLSYLSLLFFGTLHSNGYIFLFLLCFCYSSFHKYL